MIGQRTPHEVHHWDRDGPTILGGDGWTARCSASRPAIGHVVIIGHVAIIHGPPAAEAFTRTRSAVIGTRVNRLVGPVPSAPEWNR